MPSVTLLRRGARLTSRASRYALLVLAMTAAAACGDDDDPVAIEEEPEFTTMRLTVVQGGTQAASIDVARATAQPSGALTIPAGQSTLTSTYLLGTGAADPVIAANPDDFELRIDPVTSGGVTFTRTGPFTYSVNRTAAPGQPVVVQLFHLGEGHDELEATVTLQ